MAFKQVQVNFTHVSGLAEDGVQNNFAFQTDLLQPVYAPFIHGAIGEFYQSAAAPSINAVGEYLSPLLTRDPGGAEVRIYDIGPLGGLTFEESSTFTLPAALTQSKLPSEVACVLSLRSTQDGSAADRRRRGRLYIGPVNESAVSSVVGEEVRPHNNFIQAMLNAAERLFDDGAIAGVNWGVFSRADHAFWGLQDVYVDNALDTQRRRGVAPSTRTTRVLVP